MVNIPGKRRLRLYERTWFLETAGIVPPLLTGVPTALIAILDTDKVKQIIGGLSLLSLIWVFLVAVFKVRKSYTTDKEQEKKQDYDDLRAACRVLHSHLCSQCNLSETDRQNDTLRITIHKVVVPTEPAKMEEQLEQLIHYVGGESRGAGRIASARPGISGRVLRRKEPLASRRVNGTSQTFVQEMVSQWEFTAKEARNLTPDREAWMAVPIFGPDTTVVAIVYLDSRLRTLFTKPVQRIVISGCAGIAAYINERYR